MKRPHRIETKPVRESVWDYPRPPRTEPVSLRIRVVFEGITLADTVKALRVLETSHPPVYYIPPGDIKMDECYLGDERAHPQPGGFYGGWITSNVTGPFKGEPGTSGW